MSLYELLELSQVHTFVHDLGWTCNIASRHMSLWHSYVRIFLFQLQKLRGDNMTMCESDRPITYYWYNLWISMINMTVHDHEVPSVIGKTWLEHAWLNIEVAGVILMKHFCIWKKGNTFKTCLCIPYLFFYRGTDNHSHQWYTIFSVCTITNI